MTPGVTCPLCDRKVPGGHNDVGNLAVMCPACGDYSIDMGTMADLELEQYRKVRHLVSAHTRSVGELGERTKLDEDTLAKIVESARSPSSLVVSLDDLLLHIRNLTTDPMAKAAMPWTDYTLFKLRSSQDLKDLASLLVNQGLVEWGKVDEEKFECKLTLGGWRKVDEMRKAGRDSSQAFVAMWFDNEMSAAWEGGFEPALKQAGWNPMRVDKKEFNDRVDDYIVTEIRRSGLLVADFTGNRGGVYFEAGLAAGLGLSVVWTVRKDHLKNLHFDTRQYNHVVWESTKELREKLYYRVMATAPGPIVISK
jgi:hypothetical protein